MFTKKQQQEALSRRSFLKITGATLGLSTVGAMVDWEPGRHIARGLPPAAVKRMIIINLRGGNDGLNTCIPISTSEYYTRRAGGLAIPPGSELALSGEPNYGIHPSLPNIRNLFNAGSVAIINRVGYDSANLSHFVSEDIWSFGVRNSFIGLGVPAFSGWISRFADLHAAVPMGVVSIGQGNLKDFQGGTLATPLQVNNLNGFTFSNDGSYSSNHQLRLQVARNNLNASTAAGLEGEIVTATKQSHDLSAQIQAAVATFAPHGSATYSTDFFSRRMQDIATLIKGETGTTGFPTRVFYTGFGGFDTHSGQTDVGSPLTGNHANLMSRLDNGVWSFVDDMQQMDSAIGSTVWNDTVIVVISEFGRRNYQNGSTGTDHGHGSCIFVIGSPTTINGGVYGTVTDAMLQPPNEYLGYDYDFRTIYSQILTSHMGVPAGDLTTIFPEPAVVTTSPGAFV